MFDWWFQTINAAITQHMARPHETHLYTIDGRDGHLVVGLCSALTSNYGIYFFFREHSEPRQLYVFYAESFANENQDRVDAFIGFVEGWLAAQGVRCTTRHPRLEIKTLPS